MRLLFLALLSLNTVSVFSQSVQWVNKINSEGYDEALDLFCTPNGNVYVTGQMEFTTSFDGYVLESAGIHDIYAVRYDASGNKIWAKRAGGIDGDKGHSITVDPFGNVYIAGEIEQTANFDTITVSAAGTNNFFVAKYDPAGNALWVRTFGTNQLHTRGYGITCDSLGNVYACGAFENDMSYNGNYLYTSYGNYDALLVKFDTNGNLQWTRQIGGTDVDRAWGIAVSRDRVYLTGTYAGTLKFTQNFSLQGLGGADFFLASYDTSGTFVWAKRGGGASHDRGFDVTINTNGNILVTGEFSAQATFGNYTINSSGNMDMFTAAYDDQGNVIWVLKGGGVEDDAGRNITHDNAGNIFVGGDYADVAHFPPYQVTSNGYADAFLVSYDKDGNTRFVKSFGGPAMDRGRGVGVDNNGNIYFSGEYTDSIYFDGLLVRGQLLYDVYVVKLGSTPIACSSSASVINNITCHGACDGRVGVAATGLAPFAYSWSTSPSQDSVQASNLCPGSYTVTVTDANGCTSTSSVAVIEPAAMTININATDPSCQNACDGIAAVSATGTGSLSYAWSTSPAQTTDTATGLCDGSYTVEVTDNNGCTISANIALFDPNPPAIAISTDDVSCAGLSDGSAMATVVGDGPFTYSWNTSPAQTNAQATGIPGGNYEVVVTDSRGCTNSSSVNVFEPDSLQLSGTVTNATCAGCSDGTIDITMNGGISPYHYSWSDGSHLDDRTNLTAGIFSLCVTDDYGCTLCDSFEVAEPGVGINDNDPITWNIYPNPARDYLLVQLQSVSALTGDVMEIYNSSGQLVHSSEIRVPEIKISVSAFAKGTYFIRLRSPDGHSSFVPFVKY